METREYKCTIIRMYKFTRHKKKHTTNKKTKTNTNTNKFTYTIIHTHYESDNCDIMSSSSITGDIASSEGIWVQANLRWVMVGIALAN